MARKPSRDQKQWEPKSPYLSFSAPANNSLVSGNQNIRLRTFLFPLMRQKLKGTKRFDYELFNSRYFRRSVGWPWVLGLGALGWWLAWTFSVGGGPGCVSSVVGFGSLRHWQRVSAPNSSAIALECRCSRHALMFLQRPELPQPHAFRWSSELLRQKGLVYEPNLPQ